MSCEYSKKHPLDPLRSSLSCSIVFPIQLAHKHTHHSTFIRNWLIHKHWGLCLFQLIKHLKLTLPGFCFTTHQLRSSPKLRLSELLHGTTLCLYLLQATTAVCSSYQHTTKNSKTIEYKNLAGNTGSLSSTDFRKGPKTFSDNPHLSFIISQLLSSLNFDVILSICLSF